MDAKSKTAIRSLIALLICVQCCAEDPPGKPGENCDVTKDFLTQVMEVPCRAGLPILIVTYDNRLWCDKTYSTDMVSFEPTVAYPLANVNATYALLMLDPDADTVAKLELTFHLHWAVTNIKGEDIKAGKVDGREIMEYEPPAHPSGTHRYQIILFPTHRHYRLVNLTRDPFSLESIQMCNMAGSFQFKVAAG